METVTCPNCGKETTHFKRNGNMVLINCWCRITYTEQDKVVFNKKDNNA